MAKEVQDQEVSAVETQQQQSIADSAKTAGSDAVAAAPEDAAVDVYRLGVDELDSVSVDDQDRIIRTSQEKEPGNVDAGKAGEKPESEKGAAEKVTDAAQGETGTAGKPDLGKEAGETDEGAGEAADGAVAEPEVTHDPLIDTKRALTKAQQEAAELRKRLAAIEQEKINAGKPDFTDADILNDEEIEALGADEGPEAVIAYYKDLQKYNSWKAQNEQAIQRQVQDARLEQASRQDDEVLNFLKAEKGWDLSTHEQQINEWYEKSPDFKRLSDFVSKPENGFAPGKDGVFTAAALRNAWKLINLENTKSQAAQAARVETVEAIKKAQNGGSKLDRVPANGRAVVKSLENMSQAEIAALPQEQINELMKDL